MRWYNKATAMRSTSSGTTRRVEASGMKSITLTQNKFALVDDEDYIFLMQWKWRYKNGYAMTGGKKTKLIRMHRLLLQTPQGYDTDHVNCNKLDNRRENLRICTSAQNKMNNQIRSDNKSGYKGVSFCSNRNKWQAFICVNKKSLYLGLYDDKKEAARAYNNAAAENYGEYARINDV